MFGEEEDVEAGFEIGFEIRWLLDVDIVAFLEL